jgi:RimJ/RimL family protein N-acetyltransferase
MHVHRLSDGQQMWIRPIQPDDKCGLQEGLRKLSLETVHRRFLAAKPSFSSSELRYLTEVDGVNHIALVAVNVTTGRLVAVARAVRLDDDPETAEWAIVVADPLQGKGLGTHLIESLVDEARKHGIHRFTATMLGDNPAVAALLRKVSARFERDVISGGFREIVVEMDPAALAA